MIYLSFYWYKPINTHKHKYRWIDFRTCLSKEHCCHTWAVYPLLYLGYLLDKNQILVKPDPLSLCLPLRSWVQLKESIKQCPVISHQLTPTWALCTVRSQAPYRHHLLPQRCLFYTFLPSAERQYFLPFCSLKLIQIFSLLTCPVASSCSLFILSDEYFFLQCLYYLNPNPCSCFPTARYPMMCN